MNHSPLITTIITTFQRPQLLKRAIKSVLNQTYPHFQICVYDNASKDTTSSVVRILGQDSRIKYHCHAKNIGMMANYQFAFDQINTPYFNFLSDDDYLLPNFFETALQGFQNSPEAAFSACAVAQINEDGHLIGNPLSTWALEGPYQKELGLLEMLRNRNKFPVPTGVLFQTKLTKQTPPNFQKEIQLYWDPAYLLRLAAQFPIFIQKKVCAVYTCHSQTFCYSIYANMLHNLSNTESFLISTGLALKDLKKTNIPKKTLKTANKLFTNNITEEFLTTLKNYVTTKKYGWSHFSAKIYYQNFGFSFKIFQLQFLAFFFKGLSILKNIFLKKNPPPNPTITPQELTQAHAYGKKLLNE